MAHPEWSQRQRRSHVFGSPPDGRGSDAESKPGEGVLELVNRAADAIRALEDHAREHERTEQQVRSLQHERRAAETRIAELHHQVRELEEALKAERARVAAAESELERRTRMAEARVAEFEHAVRRIEEAIRTKILKEAPHGPRRAAAA